MGSRDLTCAGNVHSWLDVFMASDGQLEDLGLVALDERQTCLNTFFRRHFDSEICFGVVLRWEIMNQGSCECQLSFWCAVRRPKIVGDNRSLAPYLHVNVARIDSRI